MTGITPHTNRRYTIPSEEPGGLDTREAHYRGRARRPGLTEPEPWRRCLRYQMNEARPPKLRAPAFGYVWEMFFMCLALCFLVLVSGQDTARVSGVRPWIGPDLVGIVN